MVGEIEENAQFIGEESDEGLVVFLPYQSIRKHTKAFMHP